MSKSLESPTGGERKQFNDVVDNVKDANSGLKRRRFYPLCAQVQSQRRYEFADDFKRKLSPASAKKSKSRRGLPSKID